MPKYSQAEKIAGQKGLPEAVQEERLVLGLLLRDDSRYEIVGPVLKPEHFVLQKHQRIYAHIQELKQDGERADRITLAQSLMRRNELQLCDGLTYLASLEDGCPNLPNFSGYLRIIRDKADLRDLIATGQMLMNAALIGADTPEKIAKSADSQINRITAGMVTAKTSWTFEESVDHVGGLSDFLSPTREGIPMGFPTLDSLTYGLEPGLLYVIGGDSGHGKSSLAVNMATNVVFGSKTNEWAHEPEPVAYFSLEMTREAIFRRILCSRSKVSSFRLKKGFCEADERSRLRFAAADMAQAPLYIDDTSGLSVKEFCNRARRMKRERGVKVVFLDYLQLLNWREDGLRSEYEGVTFATWSLHELAKEEKIAVVGLTQFHQEYSRRKDRSARPTVDACHGSGSIKKDADVVILVFKRSQAYPSVEDEKNRVELITAKHRDGKTGTVLADWYGSWTTFVEAEVQTEQETEK